MRKGRLAMMLITLVGLVIVYLAYEWKLYQQVGEAPSGDRLKRVEQSPNYKNGAFQNLSSTPALADGYTTLGVFYDFFFKKHPNTIPTQSIPSLKTNLHSLPITEDVVVWMGHSSYYFQLNGKRFLVDPVLSGNAAPIPGSNKSFEGSEIYTVEDIPTIDYLLISHDHYDHLDYETIVKLREKISKVVCGLGVGQHFELWGYSPTTITELDWKDAIQLDDDIQLIAQPARHFSGRMLKRNNTLWLSYVLVTSDFKLYLGGDSGYDTHFKNIGDQYGPFDFAILENGQYNEAWHYIHCLPHETHQAGLDLAAERVLPVHSSKFKLAHHTWFEPLDSLYQLAQKQSEYDLLTPKIGQIVSLRDTTQSFPQWWKEIM